MTVVPEKPQGPMPNLCLEPTYARHHDTHVSRLSVNLEAFASIFLLWNLCAQITSSLFIFFGVLLKPSFTLSSRICLLGYS